MLALRGVGKRFGAFAALTDVDLEIRGGEVHCLLGENGAGKSTLCNLLFGIHVPDAGEIRLDGAAYVPRGPRDALAAGVAMVHQHFSLIDDMSVVDNLLLGQARGMVNRKAYAARLGELADRYGLALAPFARVGDISIGERQRVEIVKCLMREPRVLILDEPTAVLLPDEIRSLLAVVRRVAAQGCAVILVTHKLAEIRTVADRVSVLRQGRIAATSDAPADDIGALVRAMIQRPMEGLDPAMMVTLGMAQDAAPRAPAPHRRATLPPRDMLQLDGITVRDADGAIRLDTLTVTVRPGEIVGIAGVEGNGQSELGAVLAGLAVPDEGRVVVDGADLTGRRPQAFTAAGVGIVPEDRHLVGAIVDMSLTENLFLDRARVPTRFGLLRRGEMRKTALAMMAQFDVRAAGPDVAFGSLSGGNQQKAVLGRELTTPGLKVLLAAQPTRGLDVGAVEAVYGLIRDACARGVAVLLISSELDEIIAVADRVLVLYRGRIVGERPADPAERERIGALMAGQST
ncbi:putative ABC transporter ATP-binding protein YufO [Chelatococcus reniformis]|uniref:ABC transporter ATP-binding protein YufO n=1 Tax=Chelatococcus reniformis TaxID=1494448 RepID=A0A916U611_9HYPH|nr:putative ABC transporter ATP-binding protein YufO [Chelatococcus reniformis]